MGTKKNRGRTGRGKLRTTSDLTGEEGARASRRRSRRPTMVATGLHRPFLLLESDARFFALGKAIAIALRINR